MIANQLIVDACRTIPDVSLAQRHALGDGPADNALHARLANEIAALRKIEARPPPTAATALEGAARVAFWNLERCKYVDASAALLAATSADINLLTELDVGMARSGQRHTPRELAERLDHGYVFGVEFVELGLGNRFEREQHAGEDNAAGLHGAAILSGRALARPALYRLETDGEWFDGRHGERRLGGRMAVAATLPVGGVDVGVFAVHFESHGDPAQRGDQMQALMAGVEAYVGDGPAIIGGDFNVFTADIAEVRKPGWRAAAAADDPQRFLAPMAYEPAFDVAAAAGFAWRSSNRPDPTRRGGKDGPVSVPGRIDWFFTRGLVAEHPETVFATDKNGDMLSDHDLIAVTIRPEVAVIPDTQGQG